MTSKMKLVSVAVLAITVGGAFITEASAQPEQKRERHPEIRSAMKNLEQSKRNLQKADRDFGGHRMKAVQLVDQALGECREALKFDKD